VALIHQPCPDCNRDWLFGIGVPCPCGRALPTTYLTGNTEFRRKYRKHTEPRPPGTYSGDHSYVASGSFPLAQECAFGSGSVFANQDGTRLYLIAPSPSGMSAQVQGHSGHVAAGFIRLGLNTRLSEAHANFIESTSGLTVIADGAGLIISRMSGHDGPVQLYSGEIAPGNLIGTFAPNARSGS
jgi:hypothetical protein